MKAYACNNEPRPLAGAVTHQAQAGWGGTFRDGQGRPHRAPVMVDIHHVMSTDCRYDAQQNDPRCAGCQHIKQGEQTA